MHKLLESIDLNGWQSMSNRSTLISNVLLGLILMLGMLTNSTQNSNLIYFLILIAYITFGVLVIYNKKPVYRIPTYVVVSLGLIFMVFIFHIVFTIKPADVVESPLVKSPIFIFTIVINLFVIPKYINFDRFLTILAFLSASVVLIGLPAYHSPYTIVGITVEPYFAMHDLLPFGKLKSVFAGPNQFARFVLGGLLASVILTTITDQRFIVPLLINAFGIFLSYSRMTVVTATIGIGLYTIYWLAPKRWFRFSCIASIFSIVLLFAMMTKVLPGPSLVTGIDTSGRDILWRAGVEAWRQQPILGIGLGDNLEQLSKYLVGTGQEGSHVHNSYLRMLMTTGIIGFVAYVYLHFRTILTGLKLVDNPAAAGALVLVIAYSLNEITNIFSLFGVTVTSVVLSVSLGYVIQNIVQESTMA